MITVTGGPLDVPAGCPDCGKRVQYWPLRAGRGGTITANCPHCHRPLDAVAVVTGITPRPGGAGNE